MSPTTVRPPIPARVGALDGLRGWAALGVLIYHVGWEMFGIIYPVFRQLFQRREGAAPEKASP